MSELAASAIRIRGARARLHPEPEAASTAGMTDRFAVQERRRLTDASIPG
ncbi:hypothetical protein [Lichenicola sp.]